MKSGKIAQWNAIFSSQILIMHLNKIVTLFLWEQLLFVKSRVSFLHPRSSWELRLWELAASPVPAYFFGGKIEINSRWHIGCCKVQNYLRAERQADKFLSRTWIKIHRAGGKEQKQMRISAAPPTSTNNCKKCTQFRAVGCAPAHINNMCVCACERERKDRERMCA